MNPSSSPTLEWGEGVASDGGGLYSTFDSSSMMDAPPKDASYNAFKETQIEMAGMGESLNVRVYAKLLDTPPDEVIGVTLLLKEIDFEWGSFAGAGAVARHALVASRKAQLQPSQYSVIKELVNIGAIEISPNWLVNQIDVQVHALAAIDLAAIPGVEGTRLNADTNTGRAYGGSESQDGTLIAQFYAQSLDGRYGRRSNSRIRVGVIEPGPLARYHATWDYSTGTGSRVTRYRECTASGCIDSPNNATVSSHGTWVSWVATGSIEAGQDPDFPGTYTVDQRNRSGHIKESLLYYYQATENCASGKRAIEQAVLDGIDVINLSLAWGGSESNCNSEYDCSGLNAAIAAALDSGILTVACGGNAPDTSVCHVWYPGLRTETVAVVALLSDPSTSPYDSLGLRPDASAGGLPIRTFLGAGTTTPAIDLAAPGTFTMYATVAPHANGSSTIGGCSFATPVITASAGALRNAFAVIGWSNTNAKMLMVNLLLLGDGWSGSGVPGSYPPTTVSSRSGFGRVRAHWPDDESMAGDWGWGWRAFTIYEGQTVTWNVGTSGPESTSITEWKWATLWFEPDLQNVADIDFEVWDMCAPGGPVMLHADWSLSLRSRFNLLGPSIGGKCLQMRAYGYRVPAQGRVIYSADYYHSGTPSMY